MAILHIILLILMTINLNVSSYYIKAKNKSKYIQIIYKLNNRQKRLFSNQKYDKQNKRQKLQQILLNK